MAAERVSVSEALRFAGGFWRRAAPKVWAPLLVLGLVTFVLSPAFHIAPVLVLALLLLNVVMLVLAQGGLMREALGDRHADDADYRPGPAGLQWSRIETALLGTVALLALFFFLATVGAVFVVMLVAIVVAASSGQGMKPSGDYFTTPSGMAAGFVLLLILLGILWAGLRLYLSTPATADQRRVQVFSTWSLTQGQVLPLLASVFIVTLPTLILSFAARLLAQAGSSEPLVLALWLLYGLVFGFAYTPLSAGVAAFFYRRLSARAENA